MFIFVNNKKQVTLFDKSFIGSIKEDQLNLFYDFINDIKPFVDIETKHIEYDKIINRHNWVKTTLSKEMLYGIIYYYVIDFNYSTRRIYDYGMVKNPEKIGDIMNAIKKIAAQMAVLKNNIGNN